MRLLCPSLAGGCGGHPMTSPLRLLLHPHPRHLNLGSQQKRVWKSTFTPARGPGVFLVQGGLLDFPSCPPQDLESCVLCMECGRILSHLEMWDLSPSCGSGLPETLETRSQQ